MALIQSLMNLIFLLVVAVTVVGSVWLSRKYKERYAEFPWGKAGLVIAIEVIALIVFNVLWNSYEFVKTYGGKPGVSASQVTLEKEDRWIISRINSLAALGQDRGRLYQMHEFVRGLYEFILNDFSRWYIKLVRDRTSPWHEGKDKQAAQYTLHYVLKQLVKMLAPVTPFIAEKIWMDLYGRQSVHAEEWPAPDRKAMDLKLEKNMETAKLIFEAATAKRQEAGIKLRWPLDSMTVSGDTSVVVAAKSMKYLLQFLTNVQDIKTGRAKTLSIKLGKVMMDQALLRELIRKTQSLRKQAGLMVQDHILITLETDAGTEKLLMKHEKALLKGTGAKGLKFAKLAKGREKGELGFEGKTVRIDFRKG